MFDIFTNIEQSLFGIGGSGVIVSLILIVFFIMAFMFAGLEFKYALILSSPLVLSFASMGWLVGWDIFIWIIVVSIPLYLFWNYIRER